MPYTPPQLVGVPSSNCHQLRADPVTSVNVVEFWGVAEAATAQAALGGSCSVSLVGLGFSNSAKASTPR